MTYHIDAKAIPIGKVKEHLKVIDLVPSRQSLLHNIDTQFEVLKKNDVSDLSNLREKIKTAKRIEDFSNLTNLDFQYLNLLRREIESWFPKPHKLKDFEWISQLDIEKLVSKKYTNSKVLHESIPISADLKNIAKRIGVKFDILKELVVLSGLTRIQWVNPTAARMLVLGGYKTIDAIASAHVDDLYNSLVNVNEKHLFYKGKIGVRDIKRLINAAAFWANHSCDTQNNDGYK